MRKDGVSEHGRHPGCCDWKMCFPEKTLLKHACRVCSCVAGPGGGDGFVLHSCLWLSCLEFKVSFIALRSLTAPSLSSAPCCPSHFQWKSPAITTPLPLSKRKQTVPTAIYKKNKTKKPVCTDNFRKRQSIFFFYKIWISFTSIIC